MFVIATLGAMIASQAMISATFSCVKQSMALGCFPRLKIIHTSKKFMGQIYIPVINWFLMIMCIVVVSIFQSTTDIANAYGKVFSITIFMEYSFFFLYGSKMTTRMLAKENTNYIMISPKLLLKFVVKFLCKNVICDVLM